MKISKFLSCPVFIFKLDLNHKKIQKKCLHVRDSRPPDTSRSNVGGYRSDQINPDDPVFSTLIRNINTNLKEVSLNHMGFTRETKMSSIWFCINKHRDFNKEHIHPFSILSGVYYVKVPKNSGRLLFVNDNGVDRFLPNEYIREYTPENSSEWYLEPEENTMYIFPSWMKHYAEPNLSQKERIAISFNSNFEYTPD